MLWSIISSVLSLFGLKSWLEQLEANREQKSIGKKEQQNNDLNALQKEEAEANAISDQVSSLSDAAVDGKLLAFTRDK